MADTKAILLHLPIELVGRVDELARIQRRSRANAIRVILEDYLNSKYPPVARIKEEG